MNKPELITDPQHIVFEGCDSVVMAPEDFENILAELAAANDTAARNKWMCEEMQSQLAAAQAAFKWIAEVADKNLDDPNLRANGARTLRRIHNKAKETLKEGGK